MSEERKDYYEGLPFKIRSQDVLPLNDSIEILERQMELGNNTESQLRGLEQRQVGKAILANGCSRPRKRHRGAPFDHFAARPPRLSARPRARIKTDHIIVT